MRFLLCFGCKAIAFQRVNHVEGWESRAVLARPPTLLLKVEALYQAAITHLQAAASVEIHHITQQRACVILRAPCIFLSRTTTADWIPRRVEGTQGECGCQPVLVLIIVCVSILDLQVQRICTQSLAGPKLLWLGVLSSATPRSYPGKPLSGVAAVRDSRVAVGYHSGRACAHLSPPGCSTSCVLSIPEIHAGAAPDSSSI